MTLNSKLLYKIYIEKILYIYFIAPVWWDYIVKFNQHAPLKFKKVLVQIIVIFINKKIYYFRASFFPDAETQDLIFLGDLESQTSNLKMK